jgi:translation initiation factor IF-3
MVSINNEIISNTVKVINDQDEYLGEFDVDTAIKKAKGEQKDLICINDKADPPICKIQDFGKYQYQQKKQSKKQKTPELKEIKIRPNTDDHDLIIKAKHVNQFLQNNHRVRIIMVLIGRENNNLDVANNNFEKFISMINDFTVETPQTKTNNQIYIQIKGVN